MIDYVCPHTIDAEQVKRKENDRDQSYDGRVLHFLRTRPRHATHLSACITEKVRRATDEILATG